MRVLVTGAGSYIAQAIIRRLRNEKLEVITTYRSQRPNILKGVACLKLDLCDESSFRRLPSSVDVIIHVAGKSSMYTAEEIIQSAAQGALSLQRYALRCSVRAILLISSVSIHGRVETSILDETTPTREPEIYGVSKLLVERTLAATADLLPVVALRLPSVLGSLETNAWIPSTMRKLLMQEDITIFNPNAAFNNAIDVDELSRFVVSLAIRPISGFHAFPIASSASMTVSEIVGFLRNAAQSQSKVLVHQTSHRSFTISNDYAVRHLAYKPVTIQETLSNYTRRIRGYRLGEL